MKNKAGVEVDNKKTMQEQILDFAEAHLQPYKVKTRGTNREIIPKLCPFCCGGANHDENTFALSVDKGLFVCKRGSCKVRGRFEDLAKHLGENVSLNRPPAKYVGEKQVQYTLPQTKLLPVTEKIYQYFESRMISRETVDAFRIASDEQGMIVFPFYMDGVNVFEKFRRPWKPTEKEKKFKEWRSPGCKAVLFGMDACSFSQPLVISEGEIDTMSLYEAGVSNVVSVPSGCDDLSWIENCWTWLSKFKQYILFGDSDEPGRKMVHDIARRLDSGKCRIVEDYPARPDGSICKDANEILYFHGDFELLEMVENAKQVPVKGLIDLSKVTPCDPTSIPRIMTNIPALDETIGGLLEGSVTIFTGKAGDGKSTIGGLLLLNAIQQGYPCCAYSGELSKEKFQQWAHLQAAGSDYITLKEKRLVRPDGTTKVIMMPFVPMNVQQRIMNWYAGKLFLYDNKEIFEENKTESILHTFSNAAGQYGCKLFLVDNMMTAMSDSEDEIKAQGKFVNALKQFAERYAVHVLIVAHPRKTKAGEYLRKDDVGGNSAIVNLADSAIVVERPDLRIIKNREEGVQRLISCCYAGDSRRIYQADQGDLNVFSWDKTGIEPVKLRADSLEQYGISMSQSSPF